MTISRTTAVVASVMALAVTATGASAQSNCQWYAQTALKQQQENERFKCGFSGAGWTIDLKAHLDWCGKVAPDVWKSEAQKRDQQLSACAKKGGK